MLRKINARTSKSNWWHINYYQNFHQKDPQDKTVQSPPTRRLTLFDLARQCLNLN